jgi:hypothetical protein
MNKKLADILSVIDLYLQDLAKASGEEIFSHRKSLKLLLYPNNGYLIDDIKNIIPVTELGKVETNVRLLVHNSTFSEDSRIEDRKILINLKALIEDANDVSQKDVYTIFYSWQSDLENRLTRGFIKNALEKSIKIISEKQDITILIDEDTRGEPGSPDIANIILAKIVRADLFIADLTPIAEIGDIVIPNPNVLFELGYAFSQLGNDRVIMVFNENFGDAKMLPFDLGLKRQTLFCCASENDVPAKRNELAGILASKIYSSIGAIK